MLIIDDILIVPLTLAMNILEKLRDEINKKSLLTEDSIKERLQELQLLLEDGDISEEEYIRINWISNMLVPYLLIILST